MENAAIWLSVIGVAGVILGLIFGGALLSTTEVVEIDVPGETQLVVQCSDGSLVDNSADCPPEVIPEDSEPMEKIVEVEIDLEDTYLWPAIDDIFDELDRDDEFLTCEEFEYDDSEIEVTKVLEWSYTWLDDDEYEVEIEAKWKFDEDDERSCRETRTYKVFYEEGENPEVELIV